MFNTAPKTNNTILVVDVHVQRLRKKIEKEVEKPEYILTVSGVGYKLQAI